MIRIILSETCSPSNFRICSNAHEIDPKVDNPINHNSKIYGDHPIIEKSLKRVSWDTLSKANKNEKEIEYEELSPPKIAKVGENTTKDEKKLQPKESNNMPVSGASIKLIDGAQSSDIFGDSFLPENLSDLSCLNSKSSKLRNSRSCPNTPNFDVCSEKLLVDCDVSELDSVLLDDVQSHQDFPRESTRNFPARQLEHRTNAYNQSISEPERNVHLLDSNISPSLYTTKNGENELFSALENMSKSHNSSQNTDVCDIKFKTPLQAASHGTSHPESTSKPQNIDNEGNIHTNTPSFTFSDSDTDAYAEINQNITANSRRHSELW